MATFTLLAVALATSQVRFLQEPDLPCKRPHGIAFAGGKTVSGGLRGLWIRSSDQKWTQINSRAVKQIEENSDGVWVLYGDGSVDKIDPATGRLYFDVFQGSALRPWFACMDSQAKRFGGAGGWLSKTKLSQLETYPKELDSTPVTCLLASGRGTWLGSQSGLFLASDDKFQRFGMAAGLIDPWITAVAEHNGGLFVGTASAGVFRFNGKSFSPISTPFKRIRQLLSTPKGLAVGSLDGGILLQAKGELALAQEEVTFLKLSRGELFVGTVNGIRAYRQN